MKRFWLVLLSLGLVLAFSASAFAVDVKFSGSFYAAGLYLDKTSLRNDLGVQPTSTAIGTTGTDNVSTAFYYQRLRVQTDFIVSPGLKLVTRFDAMERIWGGQRSDPTGGTTPPTLALDSAGTKAENENIAFDWAYITYESPIGTFDVGIMNDGETGTIFGNSYNPAGRIKYAYTIGPATIKAAYTKVKDKSYSAVTDTFTTDADNDKYGIEGVYTWKDGKAGMQIAYYRYAESKAATTNYMRTYFQFTPYAIAKIGPVALQAELNYATGRYQDMENSLAGSISLENLSGWVDATADFGTVYFGGTFAYVSGDDPGTADKKEGGTLNGGRDWNPCLIMFNQDLTYWVGTLPGYGTTTEAGTMSNAWFFQGKVGGRPLAALDIVASLAFANADKKPKNIVNNAYGWELDVTGTYKITNNLSYMLGGGYFWTGGYYRGTLDSNPTRNNFLLINKLTLTF